MYNLEKYLSKFSEDGYLYGKLVLFKNNEQIFCESWKIRRLHRGDLFQYRIN